MSFIHTFLDIHIYYTVGIWSAGNGGHEVLGHGRGGGGGYCRLYVGGKCRRCQESADSGEGVSGGPEGGAGGAESSG